MVKNLFNFFFLQITSFCLSYSSYFSPQFHSYVCQNPLPFSSWWSRLPRKTRAPWNFMNKLKKAALEYNLSDSPSSFLFWSRKFIFARSIKRDSCCDEKAHHETEVQYLCNGWSYRKNINVGEFIKIFG